MDPHKPLVFVLVVASLAFVESTRNDETLRRSGFPVRPGSPRRRRSESYRDGTVVTKTAGDSSNAEVVILNGYTSDDEMTIDFQQHRFKLRYGDFQKASFRITGGEKFVVRVRNASRCCDVGERLPSSCSLYIVVSSTASGGINVEKTIWNTKTKLTNSNFSLLTYMGLSYVGVDVIAFEPRKVGTDHFSLHLIANFTNHAVPHEAVLDAGTYEVKVARSGLVQNIDDFKNTESFTASVYVTFEARKRYLGAVIGNVTGDELYPLQYKVYPRPVDPSHPKPTPLTEVLVLNAYPASGEVLVTLDQYTFEMVKYGDGTRGNMYLKKGDTYQIGMGDDGDDGVTYYVQENVPYVNSTCVIIVDSGEEGEIEHMMHCVNAYHKVVQGKTWIFTYSALRQCSDKTDILLLGEASDAVCGDCCNRFYAMAHELHYGLGMEGHVDPGQYQLKVVFAKSVETVTQFQTASSIVPDLSVDLASKMYITVVTGVCGNDTYPPVFFSFPSNLRYLDSDSEKQTLYKYTECDEYPLSSSRGPETDNSAAASEDSGVVPEESAAVVTSTSVHVFIVLALSAVCLLA